MAGNYIPGPDAEFASWFDNLVRQVGLHTMGAAPDWTHIPAEAKDGLMEAHGRWQMAYQEAQDVPTPANIHEKTRVREAEEKDAIRPFVRQYLHCDPVTDKQRDEMGIPNWDKVKTPIGVPASRPLIVDLHSLGGFQIKVWFADEGSPGSGSILYGCNGCLLFFAWSEEPITDVDKLIHTELMTASPHVVDVPHDAQAKFLSCAARWQNNKGKLGPWSDIHNVVVG
jgi:hypothetical protein